MGQTILVLGDFRQTVTVVRSLARAGFRVTLGCADAESSTARSRYVCAVWVYDNSSAERFCDDLESYLRSDKPDLVFVVGESQLRRVIRAAQRFEPLSTWAHPDFATIARCFDKSALYELAPRLGIPSMPWRRFSDADEWRASARDMGFPVVVKRKDSSSLVQGRKALICRTAAQFDGFLATLASDPDPSQLIVQKYFAGVRHNCHVAAFEGGLIGYFQQSVLSTDELDDTGAGMAGMSVPPSPGLRAHCERLTKALGYTGIGCIQFLVDPASGEAAFLEFNARMDSTAALPYRLGYDYPRIAVEIARARRSGTGAPAGFAGGYAAGSTYHFMQGDLLAWLTAARQGSAPRALLAKWALRMGWLGLRSHHLTFDWRDPLPTFHMYWSLFGKPLLRRLQPRVRATVRRLGKA